MKIRTIRKLKEIIFNKRFWIWLLIFFVISFFVVVFLFQTVPAFRKIVLFLKFTFDTIHYFVSYPLFSIWNVEVNFLKIVIFSLFIYVWLIIWKYYKFLILRLKRKYPNISPATFTIFANIGYYLIVIIIILSSVKVIWIDLSSLGLIVGALSVWIWFWLQNIVSNFVSGLILMLEQTIKVGDYIQIDENLRWIVTNISLRYTTIKTNDNIDLVIPNQKLIENNIVNWTLNDEKVRFRIPFSVSYGTKVEEVEKCILEALKDSDIDFYIKDGDLKPLVIFKEMNNSSVDYRLYVWVFWQSIFTPNRTKSAFLKLIYTSLNNAGITIPFPQQDVYIKQAPEIKLKIDKG